MIDKHIILSSKFVQRRLSFIEETFVTLKFKDTENSNGQMADTTSENSLIARCKERVK